MKYYPHASMWKNVKTTVLSERSQKTQKVTCCEVLVVGNVCILPTACVKLKHRGGPQRPWNTHSATTVVDPPLCHLVIGSLPSEWASIWDSFPALGNLL
jgi:hypothetical protein